MGRYTSLQSYSDTNTVQQKAPDTISKGGDVGDRPQKVSMERVNNVSGSCAGAGSGDFHQYRAIRRAEQERLDELEKEKKMMKKQSEFEAQLEENRKRDEERLAKNRAKRQKKKQRKGQKQGGEKREREDEKGDDKKEEKGEKKAKIDATVASFALINDGGFLDRIEKQKQEGEKKEKKKE
mmetsp:Transcript_6983/g.17878  ORF Transcript_6983/g.17878 Transcript_6983/m.17878 type:complete len:181 (-) Transcript_6983:60-602(-)|eukprot:CAMPEP_0113881004 /NCGR_PEP_ID=MMETSP0780_2-20120614/8118_1 /TAXON_ID=652834 /ORGANISM="Palpitomonas bilix" /LENGTH=180 /DNA_ID=CAMNT_0000867779 /DNA_START=132 /DNA_END=674 /DNA_ORIENTATION=+ /assembly_acc=CAM_ASM_000599